MADAPGTCHLVGCPDKGKHPPHEIGNWLEYLAKLGAELQDKATKTAEWLLTMTEPIADKEHPKIGAADSWQAYAGAPTIPQPGCLGTAWIEVWNGELYARCSIDSSAWSVQLSEPTTSNDMAHLVDNHKTTCTNRKATP